MKKWGFSVFGALLVLVSQSLLSAYLWQHPAGRCGPGKPCPKGQQCIDGTCVTTCGVGQ